MAHELPDRRRHLFDGQVRDLANGHWLGFRPSEEIPRYGSGLNVEIMPDNERIRCSNPVTLKEFLALDLSLVTSDFPEAHEYGRFPAIAPDPGAFVCKVADALRGGSADFDGGDRRESVAGSSWDGRAQELVPRCEVP